MLQVLFSFFSLYSAGIVIKVLASIGFGIVTYTAVTALTDQLFDAIYVHYAGIPADTISILALAGLDDALGIILGGISVKIALKFVPKLKFLG